MAFTDKPFFKTLRFAGRCILKDPALIGENFQSLINMRYTGLTAKEQSVKGIAGMSKINSTAITDNPHMQSGFHFKKEQPAESHILVQGVTGADASPKIFENKTVPPTAGNFEGGATPTSLYTEDTAAGIARFSDAPNGHVAMCDGKDATIWGGNEVGSSAVITSEATVTTAITNPRDVTDLVRNTLNTAVEAIQVGGSPSVGGGAIISLWHFDGTDGGTTFTDENGNYTLVAAGNASTQKEQAKFGSTSLFLDGIGDWITEVASDAAIPDFTNGFHISAWVYATEASAQKYIIASGDHAGSGDRWEFYIEGNGDGTLDVGFEVVDSGTATVTAEGSGGAEGFSTGVWTHVTVQVDATNINVYVNGVNVDTITHAAASAGYQAADSDLYVGSRAVDQSLPYKGYIDELLMGNGATSLIFDIPGFTPPEQPWLDSSNLPLDWLVGFTRPLKGVKFYVQNAGQLTNTLTVQEWNGNSWVTLTHTDNTDAGGISFAQTGTVTWASTVSTSKPKYIEGRFLYWYNFSLNQGYNSIYQITVDAPMQKIKDLWNGNKRSIGSLKNHSSVGGVLTFQDRTTNVVNDDWNSAIESTRIDIQSMTTSESLLVGFTEKMTAIFIKMVPDKVNDNASVMIFEYWDGSDWASVGTIVDGTDVSGDTLKQTGLVSWNPVNKSLEFLKTITDEILLYYYRISVSAQLDATVEVSYMYGIPAPQTIHTYKFPMFSKDRIMLCSRQDQDKNSLLVGAANTTDVFNGADSAEVFFGDDKELMGGGALFSRLGSSLYDVTLVMKKHAIFGWTVTDANGFVEPYNISNRIGLVAPDTFRTTEIQPTGGQPRPIGVWQAHDGIYLFDNTTPIYVSSDIERFWDKTQLLKANKLHQSYIHLSQGWIDHDNLEYHWAFADASSNGELNREWVLDLRRLRWYETVRSDYGTTGAGREVLLLRFEGTDADTSATSGTNGFHDGSRHGGHTVTSDNNAVIDSSFAKFGNTSVIFDGVNDKLTIPDSPDFNFSADNKFTIDAWVYFESGNLPSEIPASQTIFYQDDTGAAATDDSINLFFTSNDKLNLRIKVTGSADQTVTSAGTISADTWTHVYGGGDGTNYYIGLSGTVGSSAIVNNTQNYQSTVNIGLTSSSSQDLKGNIDHLRVVKGEALWTANFTVPFDLPIQTAFEVEDNVGNKYQYGCIDSGHMLQLENGNVMDGSNPINQSVHFGDFLPVEDAIMHKTQIVRHKHVCVDTDTAKTIQIAHYADGKDAPSKPGISAVDPTKTAQRIADVNERLNLVVDGAIYHSLKYSSNTADKPSGYQPLMTGLKFQPVGEDVD